jgi:DNA-binding NarL/FixJ family response regulator
MNILLIDDHFCAREGVALLLNQIYPDLKVWEASHMAQGLEIVRSKPLNLVLLDVQLPDHNGLTGLKALRLEFPNLCITMFSGLDDRELVFECLRLGAMGFISKTLPRQLFAQALQDALSGKIFLPPSVAEQQYQTILPATTDKGLRPTSDPGNLGLTIREFEVLSWLVQGKCNKEIAKQLGIEEQTVKNHLRPVFQRFGVARRAELLVKVFERGIVFGKPGIGNLQG